jgi:diguanylate cyclase (GGDEF)-like protein
MAVVLVLFLAISPAVAQADEIHSLLERADSPDFTTMTDEGRELLDRLLDQFPHATPRQQVRIRLIQARNVALAGDYDRGREILSALLKQEIDAELHLRALELLANLLLQIDRHHEAFTRLGEAIDLAADVDSSVHRARVYSLASYWYGKVGATDRARELAHLSEEQLQAIDDPWEACITLEKLGLAWEVMDEPQTARQVAERTLLACKEAGDPIFINAATILLGRIHSDLGDDEGAEALLTEAIDLASENGYIDGLLLARLNLARLLARQQRSIEAEIILFGSIDAMESRQRWRHLKDARRLLGMIAHQNGDHEAAYQHFSRYLDAHERYLAAQRSRAVAFHEVQFGTIAREQELELLREQARLEELEDLARKQRWRIQLIGFGLIAIVLVILSLLVAHTTRDRRHYRTLSRRDSLSGLRNHTAFFEAAGEALKHCQRKRKPATLVLGDIDHFKQINDTCGHLVGDEIIRRVASRLQEAFGRHGITGRIGGEEFAVLLPGKNEHQALKLVEKMRHALQKARQTDPEQPVTISFGIAQSREAWPMERLRQAADDALYAAKHAGRDQVVAAQEPAP